MALPISSVPVLTGKVAKEFIRKVQQADRNNTYYGDDAEYEKNHGTLKIVS